MTDESILQLQEALEQYSNFAILMTTELPLCPRLRDYCIEIPVSGDDKLLMNYTKRVSLPMEDAWKVLFGKTLEEWSTITNIESITSVRTWIYMCLQRNLRWSDVITYWIEVIYEAEWIKPEQRKELMKILWNAESGGGWTLVTSYRIPILWEHVHLVLAKTLYNFRKQNQDESIAGACGMDGIKRICKISA
jgi:hypothetical protein